METQRPFETVVAEIATLTNQSKAQVLQNAVNMYYNFVIQHSTNPTKVETQPDTIPADEAWLYKNDAALASVLRGLDQAKKGEFAEAPDLEAAALLLVIDAINSSACGWMSASEIANKLNLTIETVESHLKDRRFIRFSHEPEGTYYYKWLPSYNDCYPTTI